MIYFIRDGEFPNTSIKIGLTCGNAEARKDALQTGNPRPLCVAWQISGDGETERLLHEFFKKYNIRGEWFNESGDFSVRFYYLTELARNIYRLAGDDEIVFIKLLNKCLSEFDNESAVGFFGKRFQKELSAYYA